MQSRRQSGRRGSSPSRRTARPEPRRILHVEGNEAHRLRVEYDRGRRYVQLSGEDGANPWTVLAVDGESRQYAVAQADTKTAAAAAPARGASR